MLEFFAFFTRRSAYKSLLRYRSQNPAFFTAIPVFIPNDNIDIPDFASLIHRAVLRVIKCIEKQRNEMKCTEMSGEAISYNVLDSFIETTQSLNPPPLRFGGQAIQSFINSSTQQSATLTTHHSSLFTFRFSLLFLSFNHSAIQSFSNSVIQSFHNSFRFIAYCR